MDKLEPRNDTEQNLRTFHHRYYDDDQRFDADAYTVKGHRGIAWSVLGWELEANEDTEWSGIYQPTGNVLAIMKGDDSVFVVELADLAPISSDEYCAGCGQIGCKAYA
jgi:hypothetical protein